jgi:hypothetical protein
MKKNVIPTLQLKWKINQPGTLESSENRGRLNSFPRNTHEAGPVKLTQFAPFWKQHPLKACGICYKTITGSAGQ